MRVYCECRDRGMPCSGWFCHRFGEDAFLRWHLSKPVRSRPSYPGLREVADREFVRAVSLHMQSAKHKYVAVGGRVDADLRHRLADCLRERLPDGTDVTADFDRMAIAGRPEDIVSNHLASDGGVHIEIYLRICYKYRARVARAVADVLASR
jgi:hypothetical protein